jgi:hypothetical protein
VVESTAAFESNAFKLKATAKTIVRINFIIFPFMVYLDCVTDFLFKITEKMLFEVKVLVMQVTVMLPKREQVGFSSINCHFHYLTGRQHSLH